MNRNRDRRYPRYREPVFSKKFTAFLLLLAVVAAGFAVYIVMFTYPGIGVAGVYEDPSGYENTPNTASQDAQINNGNDTLDTEDQNEIGEQATVVNTPPDEVAENPSSYSIPYDPYVPYVPSYDEFVLLTTVDNSQLPWYLKLVNRYNFLDYYFHPQLMAIGGGHYFDARAYRSLLDMLESARSEGLSPIVASSFRSVSRQTTLFNNRIQRFIDDGYEEDDAFEAARRIVAYPGTSEHNLGLAVDIVALSYQNLTENQANTPEGIWLAQNSYRYGFVLRYPEDKQHITNIIFEPWHFRYVGRDAAAEMFYRNLVLEEFVSELLGS
ncbi:MAG: M15 family metallopeptidase [Defluviitaleaceae bacterium]|nr:M15 family metallopeptidase [Defluviitaleaceae bacterium]